MAYPYWNRYSQFIINGEQTVVPYVQMPSKPTDKTYIYTILIVPFPLLPSLQDYKAAIENHFFYYGR